VKGGGEWGGCERGESGEGVRGGGDGREREGGRERGRREAGERVGESRVEMSTLACKPRVSQACSCAVAEDNSKAACAICLLSTPSYDLRQGTGPNGYVAQRIYVAEGRTHL
jgi:hypothetical protein